MSLADDPVDTVAEACAYVAKGRLNDAAAVLEERYPATARRPRPDLKRRTARPLRSPDSLQGRKRTLSSRVKLEVLQRDGFTCRYRGERLVHPSVLYILSFALEPRYTHRSTHPFGMQKLSEGGHPAHFDLFPAVDHVVPVARGGPDDIDNLVTAGWAVNLAKRDSTVDEFENLAIRPLSSNAVRWDGLSGWAVGMLERFPGRFDVGRNVSHSRDLLASWRQSRAV